MNVLTVPVLSLVLANWLHLFFHSLGQLASMAGIDKSDFRPPGNPQFSSTMRPPLVEVESLNSGKYRDVGTRTDALSLVRA